MIQDKIHVLRELTSSIDGWLSFDEGKFLYETARRLARKGAVVEIGSWKGKSTIWLANGVKDGGGETVYAIDPHTGAPEHHEIFKTTQIWTFDTFKKNIAHAGVTEYVTPFVERSEIVARTWKKPVAFLWVDGAHAYEAAKTDFDAWFPYVLEGGVIAYHDSTYDDVKRVVKENIFFSRHFKQTGVVGTVTFGTKVSPSTQTAKDKIRNHYIYALVAFHGLRNIPMPAWMRAFVKRIFRTVLTKAQ